MANIDSDSDSDGGFRINQDYADKYNKWRQKEELQKLKDKYGDVNVSEYEDDSSSESEDDDAEALTEKLDREWLQTLTALKQKDPIIYDKNATFYESSDSSEDKDSSDRKSENEDKKQKPYLLKDYQRDIIVEKGGVLSDSEDDGDGLERKLPKNYYEEQDELKKSFKSAAKVVGESDSEDEFLTKRKVTQEDRENEDEQYKEWLKEQKPSKGKLVGIDPWDKPNLTQDEKFLRDYILNKKYVNDSEDDERIPTYDEIVNVDEEEEELEKQETFERKFNFRYEDPDQDFIKSYPRTVGESVRSKDNRRAKKRQEAKERKLKEKEKKKEELKQLKNLKKREIMDKIDLIKEVTGNTDIGFAPEDIEDDFDPAKYDKMMKDAFSDNYYDEGEDETKPTFDDEEELEIDAENWDDWVPEEVDQYDDNEGYEETGTAKAEATDWDMEEEPGSKKRKRKSKFAKAIARKKPVFDPNDKTFEEYLDEYYKLDYEDIIGDQPCRFKYRSVVPNDFGLSTDDVLTAKERELNQWVSVKKMSQYRTKEEELYDVRIFQKKSKRKTNVLKSLVEEVESDGPKVLQGKKKRRRAEKSGGSNQNNQKQKVVGSSPVSVDPKRGKKRKAESSGTQQNNQSTGGFVKKQKLAEELIRVVSNTHSMVENRDIKKKNKRRKNTKKNGQREKTAVSDERLKAYGLNPKKFKFTKAKQMKKRMN